VLALGPATYEDWIPGLRRHYTPAQNTGSGHPPGRTAKGHSSPPAEVAAKPPAEARAAELSKEGYDITVHTRSSSHPFSLLEAETKTISGGSGFSTRPPLRSSARRAADGSLSPRRHTSAASWVVRFGVHISLPQFSTVSIVLSCRRAQSASKTAI